MSRCTFSKYHRGSNLENELQGLECRQEAIWNLQLLCGRWEVTGETVTVTDDSDSDEKCR